MVVGLGTQPFIVSPQLVQRELFSSMFEVHTVEIGLTCGVLVVLFFIYDRPNAGLFLLSLFTLTALGYVPYPGPGKAMVHMVEKPWYFLLALTFVPVLYTTGTWLLQDRTDHLEDSLTAIED